MKLKLSKTLINGGLFSIFSFINQGISFILLIVLAKYIQPSEYGSLSLYNTVSTFVGYFIALSTTGYVSVSYFRKSRQDFCKDFSAIITITTTIFTFLIIVVLFFSRSLSSALELPKELLYVVLVNSFFHVFFNMNLDYNRIQEKVGYYGVLSLSFAILNFVLSLLFVITFNLNWQGRVYAQLGCSVAFGLFSLLAFFKYKLYDFKQIKWERYKFIILWGVPLIPHLAALWIRQGADRYIINSFHDISEVGLFSFALNLANVIISVGLAFNATNSVSIYQELSLTKPASEKMAKLKKQSKMILIIYLFATIAIAFGISVIVPLLLPAYTQSLGYFYILAVYGFIQCLYFLVCNFLFYYNRNKEIMYITFTTAILHLFLSLIFTRFSLYLTCFIYVFIEALIVALVFWRSKKAIKENLYLNE